MRKVTGKLFTFLHTFVCLAILYNLIYIIIYGTQYQVLYTHGGDARHRRPAYLWRGHARDRRCFLERRRRGFWRNIYERRSRFLSKTNQSTSVTFYPVSADKYSTQPDSVADRPVYDAPFYILTKNDVFRVAVAEEQEGPSYFMIFSSTESLAPPIFSDTLTISGTTLTFTPRGESTAVTKSDVMYYPTETGAYTYVTSKRGVITPEYGTYFALENTPVYCFGQYTLPSPATGIAFFMIDGTPQTNTMTVYGADTHSDSAEITITDNQITDVSFSIATADVSINPASLDDGNIRMFYMVLPVEVGGSGGSGMSSTLTTILSVIPLILTVGLVIGAIGFLRMKN